MTTDAPYEPYISRISRMAIQEPYVRNFLVNFFCKYTNYDEGTLQLLETLVAGLARLKKKEEEHVRLKWNLEQKLSESDCFYQKAKEELGPKARRYEVIERALDILFEDYENHWMELKFYREGPLPPKGKLVQIHPQQANGDMA